MTYVCPTPWFAHIHVETSNESTPQTQTDTQSTSTADTTDKAKPESVIDYDVNWSPAAYVRYNRGPH